MDWNILIALHYPHDRFAVGFETLKPSEADPYYTFRLYLFVITVDFNFVNEE